MGIYPFKMVLWLPNPPDSVYSLILKPKVKIGSPKNMKIILILITQLLLKLTLNSKIDS